MSDSPYQSIYTHSRALLIGINSYSDSRFVPLGEAESDASSLSSVLSQAPYHFDVQMLLGAEATKAAILDALFDLRDSDPDDRLLIYFAGHGYSLTDNFGHETGYLAAADTIADRDHTALELQTVTDLRRHTPAKHVSFVFDACFSGQALGLTRAPSVAASAYMTRRAYQVISAGAGDQTVSDFGSMTGLLIDALRMDLAGVDGVYTLGDLGLHLQQTMAADSGRMQIPQFGHLKGSQGGDFVILQQTGPRLPHDLEITLKSSSGNVRWGGVAELIDLAATSEDEELADLARERLESLADNDPDDRVRGAASSYFAETEARRMLEEAQAARQITPLPVSERIEPVDTYDQDGASTQTESLDYAPPTASRKFNPLIVLGAGGVLIIAVVVGIIVLSGGPGAESGQEEPAAAEILQTEEASAPSDADPSDDPAVAESEEMTAEAGEAPPEIEPTAAPVKGNVLFEDDMSSGSLDEWTLLNDEWEVVEDETGNNVLKGIAPNEYGLIAEIGDTSWDDYVVEFRYKALDVGLTITSFTVRTSWSRAGCESYRILLSSRTGAGAPHWLGHWPDAASCDSRQDTFTGSYDIGNWYTVRIEVYQTGITLYIDGKLVASLDDDVIPDGFVTLRVEAGSTIYYDDIRVTELLAP